jgi:hypothetical protein
MERVKEFEEALLYWPFSVDSLIERKSSVGAMMTMEGVE